MLDKDSVVCVPGHIEPVKAPWSPMAKITHLSDKWCVPDKCTILPLPLLHKPARTVDQTTVAVGAVCALAAPKAKKHHCLQASNIMTEIDFDHRDTTMIYMLQDPFFDAFKQPLVLWKINLQWHATAGLSLYEAGSCIHLASILPHTPAAKIPYW
jgi:hypothetical protein